MTHTRYGWSIQDTNGQHTHKAFRWYSGAGWCSPESDKIRHYRQILLNRPDPITFIPSVVDTSDRVYYDFNRLLFLHAHREASDLANELPEESDQFRFLLATCLSSLKGSVGLFLTKHRSWGFRYVWSVVSDFYSITTFHSFETSYSTFSSFSRSLSSMFCGTWCLSSSDLYLCPLIFFIVTFSTTHFFFKEKSFFTSRCFF
jgi:hypothetical protein